MSPERLQHLLTLVGPVIAKKPCRSRKPIPAAKRLMVTLRYLATGDSQQSQSFTFRIGRATISNILRETLQAIWDALNKAYLAPPSNTEDWIHIAEKYEEECNFPHCLGAIDGKHIMIECPANAGSAYYNYKNFHSIVLLKICGANYCFSFVHIGAYGGSKGTSCNVLACSLFNTLDKILPHTLRVTPFYTVVRYHVSYPYLGTTLHPSSIFLHIYNISFLFFLHIYKSFLFFCIYTISLFFFFTYMHHLPYPTVQLVLFLLLKMDSS